MPSIKTQDLYRVVITEAAGIAASWDVDFTVSVAPTRTNGFLVLSPENAVSREVVYFHNVIGNRIYVRWVNRRNPKLHSANDSVQMNDVEDIFNYYSDMVSPLFYMEKTGTLNVRIWGGTVLVNRTQVTVADTNLTLTDNATNYIVYDYLTNVVSVNTTGVGLVKVTVTVTSGVIGTPTYNVIKESYADPYVPDLALVAPAVQNQQWVYAAATGAVNTYAITLTPAPTAYAVGQKFAFKANLANTGTATLNVNGLGAKTIKKLGGTTNLASGDIAINHMVEVEYNGTDFDMQSPIANNIVDPAQIISTYSWILWDNISTWFWIGSSFVWSGYLDTYKITQVTSSTSVTVWNTDANTRMWFFFTTPTTEKVNAFNSIALYISKTWTPVDSLEFRLLDSTKTLVSWWATMSILWTSLTTWFVKQTLTVSQLLIPGAKYYLEIRRSSANDASNYYNIQISSSNINTWYWYTTYTATTATWLSDNENDPLYEIQYSYYFTPWQIYLSDVRYPKTSYSDGLCTIWWSIGSIWKIQRSGNIIGSWFNPWSYYYLNNWLVFDFQNAQQLTYDTFLMSASDGTWWWSPDIADIEHFASFTTPSVVNGISLNSSDLGINGITIRWQATGLYNQMSVYWNAVIYTDSSNQPWSVVTSGTWNVSPDYYTPYADRTYDISLSTNLIPWTKYWIWIRWFANSLSWTVSWLVAVNSTNITWSDYWIKNYKTGWTFVIDNTKELYYELKFVKSNVVKNSTTKTITTSNDWYWIYSPTAPWTWRKFIIGKWISSTILEILADWQKNIYIKETFWV